MMNGDDEIRAIAQALARPFEEYEVKFMPKTISGNRAMAVAFVDARVVMDRLDDVLGIDGWRDSFSVQPDGSVLCRLELRLGGEWVAKEDVGAQSAQPDQGDRAKSAFSSALKRAAEKFGVARYLRRCKPGWVDYDAQKRQFTAKPQLNYRPRAAQPPPRPQPRDRAPAPAPAAQPAPAEAAQPANGESVRDRAARAESWLLGKGLIDRGWLTAYLRGTLGETWADLPARDVQTACAAFSKLAHEPATLAAWLDGRLADRGLAMAGSLTAYLLDELGDTWADLAPETVAAACVNFARTAKDAAEFSAAAS